jgi:hypothetical protein
MNAATIQKKLRTIEGLHAIEVNPVSAVATPFFVIKGYVQFHGERFVFQTEIKITEFNTNEDVARLGASLLAAVAKADDKHLQTLN